MWQPINTAPKDGTQILACWAHSRQYAVTKWSGKDWVDPDEEDRSFTQPSHWQPIQPIPQA